MSNLEVTRGSVSFKADGMMTIEQIGKLAAAAQIIGIPPEAQITNVYFRWGSGTDQRSEIDLSWQVGNPW